MNRTISTLLTLFLLAGYTFFGQTQGETTSITLTDKHPTGYFPIDPQTAANKPAVLRIRTIALDNPDRTSFHLLIYLVRKSEGQTSAEKQLIGDVGFYPPDRPAEYALRASRAFAKMSQLGAAPAEMQLEMEIRRLQHSKAWTHVALTIAPPLWQAEPNVRD